MKKIITILLISFLCINVFSQTQAIVKENDSMIIKISILGESINSPFSDYGSVITSDGNEMFFTSLRPVTEKEKLKGKKTVERIFNSKYDTIKKIWSNATVVNEIINIPGKNNSIIFISEDGKKILTYQDVRYKNGEILESTLSAGNWSTATSISDIINTKYHESSAAISQDGQILYFVSDRKGGKGKRDIWKSIKGVNGKWGTPENLGETINSSSDEEAVFLHSDGKTLYFSSKGHNSIGGYDVFKSSLVNGKWSTPVSLGEPINTTGNDLFFMLTANGKMGYYTSSRDINENNINIYEIQFNKKPKKVENPIVSSKVDVVTAVDKKVETKGQKIEIIEVKKKDKEIKFKPIFFDFNKYSLSNVSINKLTKIVRILNSNTNVSIEIIAHTDSKGSFEYNDFLAEKRAKSVIDYLISQGIHNSRLSHQAVGEKNPIISDVEIEKMKTPLLKEKAHSENRCIEFKVVVH